MYRTFRAQIDTLRMNLGLSAADISDAGASPGDRARVAAMKIESFWDKLAAGGSRPRPVPPQLALRPASGRRILGGAGRHRSAIEIATALKAERVETPPAGPPANPPDSAAAVEPPAAQGR
jgi:hypothetical protein